MEYAKLSTAFWTGATGREICQAGVETTIISLYLLSNTHANMLGLYYIPLILVAHETKIPLDKVEAALVNLKAAQFCDYDRKAEFIWVYEMARLQIANELKLNDKQIIAVNRLYQSLPENQFLQAYYEKYYQRFHIVNCRRMFQGSDSSQNEGGASKELPSPIAPPSKPISISVSNISKQYQSQVTEIFQFWKEVMNCLEAQCDDKRAKLIENAISLGYSTSQLKQAIQGCAKTPHNIGENDTGQRYDGLHIILGSADQIDRFIRNNEIPLKIKGNQHTEQNIQSIHNWVKRKVGDHD